MVRFGKIRYEEIGMFSFEKREFKKEEKVFFRYLEDYYREV